MRRPIVVALLALALLYVGAHAHPGDARAAEPERPRPDDPPFDPDEGPPPVRPTTPPTGPTGPAAPQPQDTARRDQAMARVRAAQELASQGAARRGEAIAALRDALALYPAYPLAHHELGLLLAESGDLPGAEANLRRALALAPEFARAHQALGEVLRRSKRHEHALASYTTALREEPGDTAAWYGLAASLRATKRPAESLWALQRLVDAAKNPDAGIVVEAKKAIESALAAGTAPKPWPGIDKAVAEAPPVAPPILPRHAGDDDFDAQRYVGALQEYLALAKAKGGDKDAVLAYKIGAVYTIMNETRLAIGWWRKALSLEPGREIIGRHLALLVARYRAAEVASGTQTGGDALERARAALLLGDPATALWLVEGVAAPQAVLIAGEARLQLGDYIGARVVFEGLLAKDPEDRLAKGGLAEALLRGPSSPRTNDLAQKTLQAWLGDDEARADTFFVLRRAELDARVLMPAPPEDDEDE